MAATSELQRFLDFEYDVLKRSGKVLSPADHNALRGELRAEFRRTSEFHLKVLLDMYKRFSPGADTLQERVEGHTYLRAMIQNSHQLSKPDPDISIVTEFKLNAEQILNLLVPFRQDIQGIMAIRNRNATGASWTGTLALKEKTDIIDFELRQDIERAGSFLLRAQKPKGWKVLAWEEARIKGLRDKFLEEPLNANHFQGHWQNAYDLKGGLSRAGIWVQLDEHGKIIDRIVRKNDYLKHHQWLSAEKWHGNPMDISNRVPLEYWLQNECSRVSRFHFANMRAWNQDLKNKTVSLYVEYCPHTDLGSIQSSYAEYSEEFIPEAALWFILRRLYECCLIMRQGGIDSVDPQWRQIVRRDIKPHNVFLDEPSRYHFPCYPLPKMGDFGLAFVTDEKRPLNPQSYNYGAGTSGFKAPEQMAYANSETAEPMDDWKLLDHTNVYGVGILMYSLACGRIGRYDQPEFLEESEKWQITDQGTRLYSQTLLDLIMECIEWHPDKRIELDQLHEDIVDIFCDSDYLREASLGQQEDDPVYRFWFPEDKYAMNMTLPAPETQTTNEGEQLPGASLSSAS